MKRTEKQNVITSVTNANIHASIHEWRFMLDELDVAELYLSSNCSEDGDKWTISFNVVT